MSKKLKSLPDVHRPPVGPFLPEHVRLILSFALHLDRKYWKLYCQAKEMITAFFPRHWKRVRHALHGPHAVELFEVLRTYIQLHQCSSISLYAYRLPRSGISRLAIDRPQNFTKEQEDFRNEITRKDSKWYRLHCHLYASGFTI